MPPSRPCRPSSAAMAWEPWSRSAQVLRESPWVSGASSRRQHQCRKPYRLAGSALAARARERLSTASFPSMSCGRPSPAWPPAPWARWWSRSIRQPGGRSAGPGRQPIAASSSARRCCQGRTSTPSTMRGTLKHPVVKVRGILTGRSHDARTFPTLSQALQPDRPITDRGRNGLYMDVYVTRLGYGGVVGLLAAVLLGQLVMPCPQRLEVRGIQLQPLGSALRPHGAAVARAALACKGRAHHIHAALQAFGRREQNACHGASTPSRSAAMLPVELTKK